MKLCHVPFASRPLPVAPPAIVWLSVAKLAWPTVHWPLQSTLCPNLNMAAAAAAATSTSKGWIFPVLYDICRTHKK